MLLSLHIPCVTWALCCTDDCHSRPHCYSWYAMMLICYYCFCVFQCCFHSHSYYLSDCVCLQWCTHITLHFMCAPVLLSVTLSVSVCVSPVMQSLLISSVVVAFTVYHILVVNVTSGDTITPDVLLFLILLLFSLCVPLLSSLILSLSSYVFQCCREADAERIKQKHAQQRDRQQLGIGVAQTRK